jgi:hypothetical protein
MKLIISRKGIDSSFGNVASPILPDGRLCWLPIPENTSYKQNLPTYNDVSFHGRTLGEIIVDLSNGKIPGSQSIHLDPDLYPAHVERLPGWRPTFGQTGAAQRHLLNNGVGQGDLFLFFGWFRWTELNNGRLQYVRNSPDLHIIYGWFQIEEQSYVDVFFQPPTWMRFHPHVQGDPYDKLDTVYLPQEKLTGFAAAVPTNGAGLFSHFDENLVLTAPNSSRSVWRLPDFFYPGDRPPLSYHADEIRWTREQDGTYLRAASRGQEFVLDLDYYPEVMPWLEGQFFGEKLANIRV